MICVNAIHLILLQTYFGIEVDNIADPVRRNAIKTMIKTYGQTPKQLFRIPHPARLQSLDTPSGGSGNKLHQLFSGDRSSSGGSNKVGALRFFIPFLLEAHYDKCFFLMKIKL